MSIDIPLQVGFEVDNSIMLMIAGGIITFLGLLYKIGTDKIANKVNKANSDKIDSQNIKLDKVTIAVTDVAASQRTTETIMQTTLKMVGDSIVKLNEAMIDLTRDYSEFKGRTIESLDRQDIMMDDYKDLFLKSNNFPNKGNNDEKYTKGGELKSKANM